MLSLKINHFQFRFKNEKNIHEIVQLRVIFMTYSRDIPTYNVLNYKTD